jgi:hypothetical protein
MSGPRPQTVADPAGPRGAAGRAKVPQPGLRQPRARGAQGGLYRARDPREPRAFRGAQGGPYRARDPREPRAFRELRDPRQPRAPREGRGAPALRLTGRGAIFALLVLSFLGLIVSDWLDWGMLADATFVAACVVVACYAKPSDLLPVAVCPPLAFFVACVCAKLATSAGGTSAAEGTFVTLATSAPWLFLGTAVTILIGLRRGLLDNIRDLRRGLRGEPDGPSSVRVRRAAGGRPGGPPDPGSGGPTPRR